MAQTNQEKAAAKKRSEAAKKAAVTRKANAEAEQAKESQQESQQDSGLQTPQPDQPMPTEPERQAQEDERQNTDDSLEQPAEVAEHVAYGGSSFRADTVIPSQYQGLVERVRQAELDAAREEHNRRTAGRFDALVEA